MPHLIVEYSENLEAIIGISALVDALHNAAVGLDPLPTGGIRTRAVSRPIYRVADGHRDNGFIYVTLRLAQGRTAETKKVVGDSLFRTLTSYVDEAFQRHPLSLGLEIQEIDPESRWKKSNIRDYLQKRRGQSSEMS